MRKFSKGISLILAICMIIAMVPAAFAADEATPVTVSMLASNFTTSGINFGGNGGVTDTSGYTITWNDNSAVFVKEESSIGYFRQVYGLVDGKKPIFAFPAGHYTTAQFTFKTKIPADGHYAVSLTPILSQVGGTYGVWVNEQYAGSVNAWNGIAGTSGWTSTTTAGAEVQLNTLKLEADADDYVKVTLKNLSTVLDTTIADSYKDAYVVPMAFQEFKLTPVEVATCTGVTEDISGKDLYVGKTVDFEVSANMSDDSTFFFDSADTTTNNITATVTSGDSVELSDVAIGADGNLHGKIKGLAATESTITVTVKLGEDTTTHEIKVTPIAALVPVETTISMRDRGLDYSKPTEYNMKVTFNSNSGTRPGNGTFKVSQDTIQWLSSSTLENYVLTDYTVNENIEFVADKTNISTLRELILKDAASGATTNYGTYNWPFGSSTSDVQFTFRTKLADGAYKVSIEPVISMRGCTYGVWVGGQYAGKVDTYEAHAGTWNGNAYAGAAVSLNTLDITSDSEGWVEVTIKKISVPADNTSGVASIGFKDITFTPTDDLAVSSLSENISTTDIYKGETYDFAIKAVMNDGQIHKFDTSSTADKIEVSVPAGSAVKISEPVMKEDGLYGKITGVGEDEKATITVTTTINGKEYTNTINALSFATEVKTPETVVVSMVHGGELTTTVDSADRYVFADTDTITWGDNDKVRLDYDKTVITNFREQPSRAKIWYPVINKTNADAGFTIKVRASEGTYKVDLENDVSFGGCVYSITIGGTQVGTNDCSGDSETWYGAEAGSEYSLGTVEVTPDEEGWVEISFKYVGDGTKTNLPTSDTRVILFSNLTLTPTVKLYAAADTVDGDVSGLVTAEGYTAGNVANVAFGEKITLTANNVGDYTFLYWINNSSKMYISEEPTYTFDATSNLAISAVYTKAGNTRYDYFSDMGERISSGFGTAPDAPAIPTKIGYDVSAVTWESKKEHKVADYEAYAPDYIGEVAQTFTVNGEGSYSFNDPAEVSSSASNFSYWEKNGKTVSYNKTYSFFVWGNETVTAVCNGALTAAEKKPAVVLFSNDDNTEHMLELVGFDGIEIVEKGILFAESGKPTISSNFGKAKSTTSNNQFAVTADYAVARAYVVYKDGANLKVVYSD